MLKLQDMTPDDPPSSELINLVYKVNLAKEKQLKRENKLRGAQRSPSLCTCRVTKNVYNTALLTRQWLTRLRNGQPRKAPSNVSNKDDCEWNRAKASVAELDPREAHKREKFRRGGGCYLHKKLLLGLTQEKLTDMYIDALCDEAIERLDDEDGSDVMHASSPQQVHGQSGQSDVVDAAAALAVLAEAPNPVEGHCDVITDRTTKRPASADSSELVQDTRAKRAKLTPPESSASACMYGSATDTTSSAQCNDADSSVTLTTSYSAVKENCHPSTALRGRHPNVNVTSSEH